LCFDSRSFKVTCFAWQSNFINAPCCREIHSRCKPYRQERCTC